MNNPVTVRSMSVEELAERCRQETARRGDDRFCYELLRRALAERDEAAWAKVYAQYEVLVRFWFVKHSYFHLVKSEGIETLVNEVFTRLWQAIDPTSFKIEFPTVPSVTAYLQRCVHTTIMNAYRQLERDRRRAQAFGQLSTAKTHASSPEAIIVDAAALWTVVAQELDDPRERLLILLRYRNGLTPSDIVTRYPDQFDNVNEVYRIKRNVLSRLGRSAALREFVSA